MHWLDLGWLQRDGHWEFYPWGPFHVPYLLGEEEGSALKKRVRSVRGLVLFGAVAATGVSAWKLSWWPLIGFGVVGTVAEAMGIWVLVRNLPKGERALGFEAGCLYLARWFGPKLTRLAKWLAVALVAAGLYLVWMAPGSAASYLLTWLFVGVLYMMHYLETVQR